MNINPPPAAGEIDAIRCQRYQKAAQLIRQWSREDPEYDERVGQLLDDELSVIGVRMHNDTSSPFTKS